MKQFFEKALLKLLLKHTGQAQNYCQPEPDEGYTFDCPYFGMLNMTIKPNMTIKLAFETVSCLAAAIFTNRPYDVAV